MSKTYYIAQLEKGQKLEGEHFGLNQIKRGVDRNNNPYLDLELVDKTGSIKAKVWADNINNVENEAQKEGAVISLDGTIVEFNGQLQITVFSISNVEEYDLKDFLPVTSKDIDDLWKEFQKYIDEIKSDHIKKLIKKLVEEYEEKIRKSPAAKSVHHHYVGGLLEHIVEMLKISKTVCELYPEANQDLVYAGVIFHDIGKIRELYIRGFQIDYSKQGKLLGHISIGLKILNKLDTNLISRKDKIQLEHIILSHHYVMEFGSPVTPKTIEAMIVSKVDDLSSKVRLVQKILDNNKDNPSEFAKREFGIEGEVYLGK